MSHLSTLIFRFIRKFKTEYHQNINEKDFLVIIFSKIWNFTEYMSENTDFTELEENIAFEILDIFHLPHRESSDLTFYKIMAMFSKNALIVETPTNETLRIIKIEKILQGIKLFNEKSDYIEHLSRQLKTKIQITGIPNL